MSLRSPHTAPFQLCLQPSGRGRAAWRIVVPRLAGFLVLLVALAAPAAAELKLETLPDGSLRITNETATQRQRRTAGRLVEVRDRSLRETIERHARRVGLPARLIQAVVQAESGYNVRARSRVGAMGLMQLMPGTARELGVRDPWDPEENVRGGSRYLRQMIDRFDGDLSLGLAAYNAGPTAVEKYGGVPPYRETQAYVRKVLAMYRGRSQRALRPPRAVAPRPSTARTAGSSRSAPLQITRAANGTYIFTTDGETP